jgi:hypothetical protein
MANSTGKKARQRRGTRAACKAAKARTRRRKTYGKLPVSESRGNAKPYREGQVDVVAEEQQRQRQTGLAYRPPVVFGH